jgi:hypothetical protein
MYLQEMCMFEKNTVARTKILLEKNIAVAKGIVTLEKNIVW